MSKLISIVTPCYNEEDNIDAVYAAVKNLFEPLEKYNYEHIFIDNDSSDKTQSMLKDLASKDKRVKVIINSRNFGHIRSPYHAMLEANGDAVILLVADLQDPPELMLEFIKGWEEGHDAVIGTKTKSLESPTMFFIRNVYYGIINRLSEIKLQKNYTGFGLYDKRVIDAMRSLDDPYPYLRGLVFEIGYDIKTIEYTQPARMRGITKNNFFTLYDMAMLGISNHSKIPLRIATLSGFLLSAACFFVALVYFVYKLMFWDKFEIGVAPVVIGLFLFASIQLFFIGILGEYIGFIHTKVQGRPHVFEKERINFDA